MPYGPMKYLLPLLQELQIFFKLLRHFMHSLPLPGHNYLSQCMSTKPVSSSLGPFMSCFLLHLLTFFFLGYEFKPFINQLLFYR